MSFSHFDSIQSVHFRQKLQNCELTCFSRSDKQKAFILFHKNKTSLKGGLGMMEGGMELNSYFLLPLNAVLIFFSNFSE